MPGWRPESAGARDGTAAGAMGANAAASHGAVFGSIKIGGLTYVTAAQGKPDVEQLHSKF